MSGAGLVFFTLYPSTMASNRSSIPVPRKTVLVFLLTEAMAVFIPRLLSPETNSFAPDRIFLEVICLNNST
ncbi:hypothetical protein ES708_32862 [subsurface metagenome]